MILLRILLATLSVVVITSAVFGLQAGALGSSLEPIADRMLLGEKYNGRYIASLLPFIEKLEAQGGCGVALDQAAVIRTRAYRLALQDNEAAAAVLHLARAIDDVAAQLACTPDRAFAWFQLFSLRSARDGERSNRHLPLLGLSYQLGPNEGAFSPLRLRAALPLLSRFGPGMLAYVGNDFAQIARDQPETAAAIFLESDTEARRFMSERLAEFDEQVRTVVTARIGDVDLDALGSALLRRSSP